MYSKRISEQNLIIDDGGRVYPRPKEQIDILINCKQNLSNLQALFSFYLKNPFCWKKVLWFSKIDSLPFWKKTKPLCFFGGIPKTSCSFVFQFLLIFHKSKRAFLFYLEPFSLWCEFTLLRRFYFSSSSCAVLLALIQNHQTKENCF